MTTLLDIKPYIRDFVEETLDNSFANKVYWIGERKNIPSYPYCLLNIIAENKDKRTSKHSGKLSITGLQRQKIVTRYKTCTITVGVYNAWIEDTYDTVDMDVAKEFAYQQIDELEGEFEEYPINKKFSVQSISPIRPLHEVVDGGYMYRYEFDLTIGYNEPVTKDKPIGKVAEVDIEDKENGDNINFRVTIQNNDNIVVETL